MKTQHFLIFAVIAMSVLIIASLFMWAQDKYPKLKKAGKTLLKIFGSVALTLVYMQTTGFQKHSFSLDDSQQFWEDHHLPQVDSCMLLMKSSSHRDYFRSFSKDSIRHDSKIVEYDVFDIYSVEDHFVNEKTQQQLSLTYIKHNILRDSSRIYTLTAYRNPEKQKCDTISSATADSILKAWDLSEKIYRKIDLRR